MRAIDLRKLLKRVHVTGTFWIALCAVFLLTIALRQAGVQWWIVFSLGGFSGVAFFMLISVYLFAFFRGVIRTQTPQEHPLTTSYAYILFYDLCPFLGSLAGLASLWAVPNIGLPERFYTLAEGTLVMTFLVWIILDPIIGPCELMIPACAAHRRRRLAETHRQKLQRKVERERLLQEALEFEKVNQVRLQETYEPIAEELANLLCGCNPADTEIRQEAAAKGAQAWRLGGISGMQFLQKMVREKLTRRGCSIDWDILAFCWDGIGTWRKPSLKQAFA